METGTSSSNSAQTIEIQSLKIDNTLLSEKVTSLKRQLEVLEEKIRQKQEENEENRADHEEKAQLKKIRDGLEASNAELKKYLEFLDEQCEQYRVDYRNPLF